MPEESWKDKRDCGYLPQVRDEHEAESRNTMRILIDLTHPADVHIFRDLIARLEGEGHYVHLTMRDKDILVELARSYGMEAQVFGVARKGLLRLATEMVLRQKRLYRIIRQSKPDVMMAIAGPYIAPLGRLLRIPTYVFYDTEHATVSNLLSYPFATCTYVPTCYRKQIRWNHVRYNGYHELTYLHPRYFQPDSSVLDDVGVNPGDRFSIMRFVGWGAVHDAGLKGFTEANKIRAVEELSRFGPVFISAEGELPSKLEGYRLKLEVSRIHHLMAQASLIFGESATMASEAAVLGVPSIFVDSVGRGYTDEQEVVYGLVFNFTPLRQSEAVEKGVAILSNDDRAVWRNRAKRLLEEKIDVADLLYNVATNRPFYSE